MAALPLVAGGIVAGLAHHERRRAVFDHGRVGRLLRDLRRASRDELR